MGLIGYNKGALALAAGAPGSTYNARSRRCTNVFKDIIAEDAIPDKVKNLDNETGRNSP